MKKAINQVIIIIFFSTTLLAQPTSKEMPKEVADAFNAKYPATAIKNWNYKNDNYIVKFNMGNRSHFAYYTPSGVWLKTETKYGLTSSLPADVKKGWKNCAYKSWIVEGIKEVTSGSDDVFVIKVTNSYTYDAEHLPEKYTYNLYFSKTGDYLKKEELHWGDKDN